MPDTGEQPSIAQKKADAHTQNERPAPLRKDSCSYADHLTSPTKIHGPGRNLVICIDGTSNQFGTRNTNVIELYHLLERDEFQLTYYDSGVGTYAHQSKKSILYRLEVIESKIDLAIAWNLQRIIVDAYKWLSEKYKPGDRIYVFGFSRGAYQVRALAAMIEKVGLIHEGNMAQISFAYELYADPTSDERGGDAETTKAERFKQTFSRNVRVHFVGAWDTVSSVGIIREKTLPLTTDGMTHVCHFRHALALDERRVKFLPEYAFGGASKRSEGISPHLRNSKKHKVARAHYQKMTNSLDQNSNSEQHFNSTNTTNVDRDVKEVWFAGTHSDIGGGNVTNHNLDRSGPPLLWMLSEAIKCGLRVNDKAETSKRWDWTNKGGPHESLTGVWWPLEWLPVRRLSYKDQHSTTRRPHLGRGRVVLPGQLLHGSLSLEEESSYKPRASFRGADVNYSDWRDLLLNREWLEQDLLGTALVLEQDLRAAVNQGNEKLEVHPTSLQRLKELIDLPGGRWTLGRAPGFTKTIEEIIVSLVENEELSMNNTRHQLVEVFLVAQGTITQEKLFSLILPIALERNGSPHQAQALVALNEYAKNNSISWCNVQRPSGEKLTTTDMETLCDTGQLALIYTSSAQKKPSGTTPPRITSIAFSPKGEYLVSGADDRIVRVYDALDGRLIAQTTQHPDRIRSVAIAPQEQLVASAGGDIVRLWNIATGEPVKRLPKKHKNRVRSVTFSPDGKYIVSGSDDHTVRIWDVAKGEHIKGGSKLGHTEGVRSIAVSPNGRYIASSSDDKTIRIRNWESAVSLTETLKGHSLPVASITFSSDGAYLVSGSWDCTVRVWEVLDREFKFIRKMDGHTNCVTSVAVCPSSKHIASGSDDGTIRIWDLKTGVSVYKPLTGHTDCVSSVVFSPNGEYVISGSRDGSIRRWRLSVLKSNDRASGT